MMVTILLATALLLYIAASGSLAMSFAGGRVAAPRLGVAFTGAALAVHALGLIVFTATHSELPLVGLAPSLCTLAFLIAAFLLVSTMTSESRPIGLVLVPLVAVLLGVALALGITPAGGALAFSGVWFSFHVLLAFIGYAGLALAFAAGLLYLLQFRELKDKRLGRIFRYFPSLPVLDRLNRRGLIVGFPALTAALLLGWAWMMRFQEGYERAWPQVIWGVLTWFVFAFVLFVRARRTANPERNAAFASVAGFVLVVISYLLLRVLLAGGRVFL